MASTSSLLPQPQQQQTAAEVETNPQGAVPSSSPNNSGSIGPFFAVMAVLAVLAIISCVAGRICSRRRAVTVTPLDSIKDRGCLGWVKRKCRRCMRGEVEVGAKVMAADSKAQDSPPV